MEREIQVQWDEGRFIYEVGKDKGLALKAARPERRCSFDEARIGLVADCGGTDGVVGRESTQSGISKT